MIFQKAKTRMVAINKKMICGSIATFSIAVIAFFWMPPIWFWTSLEIIGGLLVAAGCWGEWILFHNPASENNNSKKLAHRRWELRCIIVVAIGVSLEFASSGHSILEGIRLGARVEELRKANDALEAAWQRREINPEQETKIISLLKHFMTANAPKSNRIVIGMNPNDHEARRYAHRIGEVLQECGANVSVSESTILAIPEGLRIDTNSGTNKFFDAVANVFDAAKMPFNAVSIEPWLHDWELEIDVGPNP